MNAVLHQFLHKCVLVFFDDILIYSHSWTEHLQHLRAVCEFLRANNLHVKRAKCAFTMTSVAYLGHIISAVGIATNRDKVAAVESWPQPRNLRALRSFLNLVGPKGRSGVAWKRVAGVAEPLVIGLMIDSSAVDGSQSLILGLAAPPLLSPFSRLL